MITTGRPNPSPELPTTGSLNLAYVSSLAVALLLSVVSVVGLLLPSQVYPTEELAQSFVVTDLVNLVIGVPILLGSMGFARRDRLVGLLFWPGALFFVVYHAIAYVYAMPLSWMFLLYVALLVLSAYTLIGLVAGIDRSAVGERLAGRVPERLAGGVLIGLGAFSLLRNLGVLANALLSQTTIPGTELGVIVSDSILVPAWIIGGLLLWRRQARGYVGGTGLLFQGSMLFVGLIVWMLLAPLMTGAPFVPTDLVVILIMSLICLIPFALFVRGVGRA
jgi:hypothetical protein